MKIRRIKKITTNEPIPVYDVIDVPEHHNFLIKSNDRFIVSHNCGILDEVNFIKGANVKIEEAKIMETYNNVLERMGSRFMINGKIAGTLFVVSSKKSEYDFIETYIRRQKDSGVPTFYVSDAKLWEVKPIGTYSGKTFRVAVGGKNLPSRILKDDEDENSITKQGYEIIEPPIEFKPRFEMDMQAALMNIAGISTSHVTKFISYNNLVKCYNKDKNPFTSTILMIGMSDNLKIMDFFIPDLVPPEIYSKPLFIHIDTSVTGDITGIGCTAVMGYRYFNEYDILEGEVVPTKKLVYRHVFSVGIKCPSGTEISFQKTRDFVFYLKNVLRWNIKGLSTDGFQSVDTRQQFITMGFKDTKLVSLDRKPDGYMSFKSAINERRISLLNIEELETEIVRLERDNVTGKVDHPVDSTKDISDGLCGSMYNAMLHEEDLRLYISEFAEVLVESNEETDSYDIRDNLLGSIVSGSYTPSDNDLNIDNTTSNEINDLKDVLKEYIKENVDNIETNKKDETKSKSAEDIRREFNRRLIAQKFGNTPDNSSLQDAMDANDGFVVF